MFRLIIFTYLSVFTNSLATRIERNAAQCTINTGVGTTKFALDVEVPVTTSDLVSCICTGIEVITCDLREKASKGKCSVRNAEFSIGDHVSGLEEITYSCICIDQDKIECSLVTSSSKRQRRSNGQCKMPDLSTHIDGEKCVYNSLEFEVGNLLPIDFYNLMTCMCDRNATIKCNLHTNATDGACNADGTTYAIGSTVDKFPQIPYTCICTQMNRFECALPNEELHSPNKRMLQNNRTTVEGCYVEDKLYEIKEPVPTDIQFCGCTCIEKNVMECFTKGLPQTVGGEGICIVNGLDVTVGKTIIGWISHIIQCSCVRHRVLRCVLYLPPKNME